MSKLGFDPLTPSQRIYINATEEQEMSSCFDENSAIYQLILNNIQRAIQLQPFTFCQKEYSNFTETQINNFNEFHKIKLTWQEDKDGLFIRPILCNIFRGKLDPMEDVFFSREIAMKIQRKLQELGDNAINNLINRTSINSIDYLVKIEKDGLNYFKDKYTPLLETTHTALQRMT